jgi:hypothetical protein
MLVEVTTTCISIRDKKNTSIRYFFYAIMSKVVPDDGPQGAKHVGVERFKIHYCEFVTVKCICWIILKNRIIMHGMEHIKLNNLILVRVLLF